MSSDALKAVLLKLEAVYGTDAVPAVATDALLIDDEIRAPQLELIYGPRNNARTFYGRQQQLIVGSKMNVGFDIELAGSGAAGTAPKWGPALRACCMAEKVLAAAHAGTAQAGAAGAITLAVGASAVDNAYRPLRIRTTGGTGNGQVRVITGYNGTTKVATVTPNWTTPPDATTTYSIDAQVGYHPISAAIESASIYFYYADKLHKLLGARGDASVRFMRGERPMASLEFQGLYGGIVDDSFPTGQVLTGFQTPLGVNNQNTSLVSVHDFAAKLYSLEMRLANAVSYRNIPGAEDVRINDREPSGSVEIEQPTIAQKDYPTIVRAGTLGQVSLTHGTSNGNKVAFDAIQAQLTNPRSGSQDGDVTSQFDLEFNPSATGNDEVVVYAL